MDRNHAPLLLASAAVRNDARIIAPSFARIICIISSPYSYIPGNKLVTATIFDSRYKLGCCRHTGFFVPSVYLQEFGRLILHVFITQGTPLGQLLMLHGGNMPEAQEDNSERSSC